MLSQISIRSLPAETWAAITALITGAALITKKLLSRKPSAKPDLVTRTEFHAAMTATRDRIGASYLAMADKLDLNHRELLAAIDTQGANFERRIDQLESNMARLDERTKHTTKM